MRPFFNKSVAAPACSVVLKARTSKCNGVHSAGMQRMLHSSKRVEKWVGKKDFAGLGKVSWCSGSHGLQGERVFADKLLSQ